MSRPRDSQRSKVYEGEEEFELLLPDRCIMNIHALQAWVDGIVSSDWWRQRYPHVRSVEVRDGRRRRSGVGWLNVPLRRGVISLPRKWRHQLTILHELAHTITWDNGEAIHGKVFVRHVLDLVDQFMGPLEGAALRWFLAKNRVKWNEPTAPPAA